MTYYGRKSKFADACFCVSVHTEQNRTEEKGDVSPVKETTLSPSLIVKCASLTILIPHWQQITSVVEEAKAMKIKSGPLKNWKRVRRRTKLTDSDAESTDFFQTRVTQQDGPEQLPEPERPAERESPANLKRSLWQSYLT